MFARSSHENCHKTKTLGGLKPYGINMETVEIVANKFGFIFVQNVSFFEPVHSKIAKSVKV
jgi:hypothetical protein